jgi:hypothetical protein
MLWLKWVVLIAGSTGSALRSVALFITPVGRRDLVYAASATGCWLGFSFGGQFQVLAIGDLSGFGWRWQMGFAGLSSL